MAVIDFLLTATQNIANAQKEIDRLEAEASAADSKTADRATDTARKPAMESQGVNGTTSAGAERVQEQDAVSDAAEDLKKAKIEDETAPEGSG